MVAFEEVVAASGRIGGLVRRTPVMTSATLDSRLGARVFLKCENFQRTGSFKFRGASHAVSRLGSGERGRGVLTFSSGNHAQALARAGREAGVSVTVVMPEDAPEVKRRATEGYGAEVVLYDRDETTREALGLRLAAERGLTVIPPYDHPDIVAGAGTTALELFEDVGDLDLLLICLGGGGLTSGCALVAKTVCHGCRVVGVEPEAGDDIRRSLASGRIERVENPVTIADGARTPSASALTFGMIQRYVDAVAVVPDSALLECMGFYGERLKMVVEPTGCLSLAAVWTGAEGVGEVEGKRVGLVVSGGNVDMGMYGRVLGV